MVIKHKAGIIKYSLHFRIKNSRWLSTNVVIYVAIKLGFHGGMKAKTGDYLLYKSILYI